MTTIERSTAVASFKAGFGGQALAPGNDGYDETRAVWNGSFDKRPAVIARCRTAVEVASVIRFACESGMALAVRSGGTASPGSPRATTGSCSISP
jgi:FAD/FMN-containing dehydrogenase